MDSSSVASTAQGCSKAGTCSQQNRPPLVPLNAVIAITAARRGDLGLGTALTPRYEESAWLDFELDL